MVEKIHIIDYGYGNLFSLNKALLHAGADVEITSDPVDIENSKAVFLPGVGAFGDGILELRKRGFEEPLLNHIKNNKPFFGICLGMQFLFDESNEFGIHKGLGIIPGTVEHIVVDNPQCKIPHVGWNELFFPETGKDWKGTVFDSIPEKSQVYFVHSYSGYPDNKEHILAEAEYGGKRLVAAVKKGAVYGTQFHPEKSGEVGLTILKNFLNST